MILYTRSLIFQYFYVLFNHLSIYLPILSGTKIFRAHSIDSFICSWDGQHPQPVKFLCINELVVWLFSTSLLLPFKYLYIGQKTMPPYQCQRWTLQLCGNSKGHPNASHWKLKSKYFCPLHLGIWVTKKTQHSQHSTLHRTMLLLTLRRDRPRSTPTVCVSSSSLMSAPGSWCGAIGLYASFSWPCRRTRPYFSGVYNTVSRGMIEVHWHTHLGRTKKHPLTMK